MTLEFPAFPENIGLARVAVASFAAHTDLTLNELEEIKVAVSEAVTNAIVHAYRGMAPGMVRVCAERQGSHLVLKVEDHGRGIEDIEMAQQPAFSTDPERMGLGFVFMKSFMDEVVVESEVGRGTRVIMSRRLAVRMPGLASAES